MDAYIAGLLKRADVGRHWECQWARQARDGDRHARSRLIESGLRSVALRAVMLGFRGEELTDAVQNGTVALIEAVDRFDPERGVRLATFAWWPIARAMRPENTLPVVEDRQIAADDADEFDAWLDGLSPELAAVIRCRYGSDGSRVRSRREVAREVGITEYQVRVRESEAMRAIAAGLARLEERS